VTPTIASLIQTITMAVGVIGLGLILLRATGNIGHWMGEMKALVGSIQRKLSELCDRIVRLDDKNDGAHDRIDDRIDGAIEGLAKLEGRVDSLCNGGDRR
jgi:hypothetical protein